MSIAARQMEFDFAAPVLPCPVLPSPLARDARRQRGQVNHLAGLAAEALVAQDYERRGYVVAGTRWRGQCGEIDLILRDGMALVFVEVKKSRSYDEAFRHLGWRQVRRLMAAAEEFAGGEPLGSLTEMRFDVALLEAQGRVRVVENAFGP